VTEQPRDASAPVRGHDHAIKRHVGVLRQRLTALEDTDVLEVSTPELNDVVRLEDRYGRVADCRETVQSEG